MARALVTSPRLAKKGARSWAMVARSEKEDWAITPRTRGSTAAAWRATDAPSEEPKSTADSAATASSAFDRSAFSR
jgi:hypothetical protein